MSKEVKFSKEEVDNIQKIRDGYDELVVKLISNTILYKHTNLGEING